MTALEGQQGAVAGYARAVHLAVTVRLRPHDAISIQFSCNHCVHLKMLSELRTSCLHDAFWKFWRSYASPYLLATVLVQSYASCVHLDASKLNTVNLSKRCVRLGAIRLHLKMHAMVARKLQGNCVVWTQPYIGLHATHIQRTTVKTKSTQKRDFT